MCSILYIQGVYISHYKFCCARGSVHVCITQVMGVLCIIIVHVVYLLCINLLGAYHKRNVHRLCTWEEMHALSTYSHKYYDKHLIKV